MRCQGSGGFGPEGVYFSTSPDFIHRSKPALALTKNQMLRREPEGAWSCMYFLAHRSRRHGRELRHHQFGTGPGSRPGQEQ
jgi:hypothetical protein